MPCVQRAFDRATRSSPALAALPNLVHQCAEVCRPLDTHPAWRVSGAHGRCTATGRRGLITRDVLCRSERLSPDSALEWVAHVTHSPRFVERLMLLRLASSNTCPAELSCSMHAARSEWITSIRPVTGLCPRELAGAVDHVPCEHQLCAAACQIVQRTVLWCHAHRGRRTRSRDLSCAGGVVQAMNSTSCTSGR